MAAAACCMWVLGFELLPNLHIALHDHLAPHTHGGEPDAEAAIEGPRVFVHYGESFHSHGHGGGELSAAHLRAHALGRAHSHSWAHADDLLAGWTSDLGKASSRRYEWPTFAPLRPLPYPAHGAHSLAHRGLVMTQPAPPPAPAGPVKVEAVACCDARRERPRTRRPLVMRVRGPPRRGGRLERSIT
jgi:hypothetical protein